MTDLDRVSECFEAMLNALVLRVRTFTAKIRLGVNDQNTEKTLPEFLEMLRRRNIRRVIVHARKAVLGDYP